jgi:hypothetical protein
LPAWRFTAPAHPAPQIKVTKNATLTASREGHRRRHDLQQLAAIKDSMTQPTIDSDRAEACRPGHRTQAAFSRLMEEQVAEFNR